MQGSGPFCSFLNLNCLPFVSYTSHKSSLSQVEMTSSGGSHLLSNFIMQLIPLSGRDREKDGTFLLLFHSFQPPTSPGPGFCHSTNSTAVECIGAIYRKGQHSILFSWSQRRTVLNLLHQRPASSALEKLARFSFFSLLHLSAYSLSIQQ